MPPFQFKKFNIKQNNTAMKVGTDGVLLGAWATIKKGAILDIGTGTGLIAIMIAQRSEHAIIDAVEVEKAAYQQAKENSENCPWSERITMHHTSIQQFETTKKYDLIISNPPFFVNATKSPKEKRNAARHTDNLSFDDLIFAAKNLLQPDGIFSVILPATAGEVFNDLAAKQQLFLNKKCMVKPNFTKPAKRVLMEFSLQDNELIVEQLTIETSQRHQYTKEYLGLTHDFYLNLKGYNSNK